MISQPTITFMSALMFASGILGIYMALMLMWFHKPNHSANRYMAIMLGGFGLIFIHQFLIHTGYIRQVPLLIGSVLPMELIFPQCLYLYVLGMARPNAEKSSAWRHFVVAVVGVFFLAPFFLLDFEQQLIVVQSNYILWPGGERSLSFTLYMGVAALIFTLYLLLSFKILFAHTRSITHFFSYKENITLSWLRNFLLVMIVFWVMLVAFNYFFFSGTSEDELLSRKLFHVMYLFGMCTIPYLGTMALLQRRIYTPEISVEDALPEGEDEGVEEGGTLGDAEPATAKEKYKHSALTSEMSARIAARLEEVMKQEKPHLNSNLTLPDLAKSVSTTPNYLSQVINEQLQMNFFDYVNSFRIETAKELLINPLPHTPTILDVAMESAFNSKSAFYKAFKKQMGITPAEFKKSYS